MTTLDAHRALNRAIRHLGARIELELAFLLEDVRYLLSRLTRRHGT